MKIKSTKISGVMLIETNEFVDQRGAFSRLFCNRELEIAKGDRHVTQINISLTKQMGSIRGLHFQHAPNAEMKLVRCIRGRVWDVAVDLRSGSPTFLQWHAEELSRENARMLVIPEGCAHGFQVLGDMSEMLYLHTGYYTPSSDGRVRYDDPQIGITWPLPLTEISELDRQTPLLPSGFSGLIL